MRALKVEVIGAGKSFGAFRALDDVSLTVRPGTVHALLGENGAGKSTLLKGLIGYAPLDQGQIAVDDREVSIHNPRAAHALGFGMVYQHFTVAPGLSVAENLLLAKGGLPFAIDWKASRTELEAFMAQAPFKVPLDALVGTLAAGEKQKLEILKQLYLQSRLLILDEPTSVLTVQEAHEVLGLVRKLAQSGELSVLMITHKFAEVLEFADDVTVLRRGRLVGATRVADTSADALARWMMGEEVKRALETSTHASRVPAGEVRLQVDGLTVEDDHGMARARAVSLGVRRGEIVGLAGIAGNGQKELVEALLGQRPHAAGSVTMNGAPYRATREEMRRHRVGTLPEEPLANGCVGKMSVAENLALRDFDQPPIRRRTGLIDRNKMRESALARIAAFNVKPPDPQRPIGTLSGGNVQRAILARELASDVDVLIVANPVFGLDFAAVADIHDKLRRARDRGAAVLVASDDLDELLELADRLLIISDGEIVHETTAAQASRAEIGAFMAGRGHSVQVGQPASPADVTGAAR